jgi:NAD(P)-dependent dehydrogenase (short-subunit alcohol dehydrogenase family)
MATATRDRERLRAVVTGAASGIGRAVARRLTAEGIDVTGIDRDSVEGESFAALAVDLSDRNQVMELGAQLSEDKVPVDVLVNVAGIFEANETASFDPDVFWRNIEINLYAPTVLAVTLANGMRDRGWGRIVNVSSVAALLSEPGSLAYGASKAALTSVTRTLAIESAPRGVLVNAVLPGFTNTPMAVVDGVDEHQTESFLATYVEAGQLPIGRPAEPEEVASAIVWLASEDNTYVTGAMLVADGGLAIRF